MGGVSLSSAIDTILRFGQSAEENGQDSSGDARIRELAEGVFIDRIDLYRESSAIQLLLTPEQSLSPAERMELEQKLVQRCGVIGVSLQQPGPIPLNSPIPPDQADPPVLPNPLNPPVLQESPTPSTLSVPEPEAQQESETYNSMYEFEEMPIFTSSASDATGSGARDKNTNKKKSTAGAAGAKKSGTAGYKPKKARASIRAGNFESAMKGIPFDSPGFEEDNPKIICGVKVTEPIVPMTQISAETSENIAVAGQIVYVECRDISAEKSLVEFGLTDYKASGIVKQFILTEHLSYLKDKLKKGDWVVVYGGVQYDNYLKGPALFAVDINKYDKTAIRDDAPIKRVELHLHTKMSAMDAVSTPTELVERAAAWEHPAVAITDHGVLQAYPEACQAGKRNKIKIIYGVEGYLRDEERQDIRYHIILLVQNQTGLKNLYKLVSKSHLDYFYKKPLLPRHEIEAHREGLIVGSACESGELYQAVLHGEPDARLQKIASYYDYLEIQPTGNNLFMVRSDKEEYNNVDSVEVLQQFNRKIVALGEQLNKPVVATCDVHFVDEQAMVYRSILMAGQKMSDTDLQPPLYLRTTTEMLREFEYLGDEKAYEVVITNTNAINDRIENGIQPIPDGTYPPKIEGSDENLTQIVEARARTVYGDPLPDIVRERLDTELHTIISKGFSVMYMIAHKLVRKSNEDGYLVGSRGSVGSSFVATMAGITEVNPLPPHYICPSCKNSEFVTDGTVESGYDFPTKNCPSCGAKMKRDGQNIPFETFLGFKGAEKAPDIDLNFSGEYQSVAHKYTEELFGERSVFRAGTIGTIAEKTAFGFVKGYLSDREMIANKAEEMRLVTGCTGVKRTTGQHPGGIIVIPSDMEVYDFTPIQRPADAENTDIITTHFDFHALHDNVLKLDILGHDDPSMIRMLEDLTGIPASDIEVNDPQIMSLFTGTQALGVTSEQIGTEVGTLGLPEFGTKFVRQMLLDTKPKTFSDLLQISGLSHGENVWVGNAQDLVRDGTCTISDVIGTRDNIMVYLMYRELEPLDAFNIMEAVRKGKGLKLEQESLMRQKGVPDWYISSCKKISYMFPKAHAAAYVLMAYRQAWYKINRPKEYYTAYYTIRADDFDAETMTRGIGLVKEQIRDLSEKGNELKAKEKSILTILELVVEMYAREIHFLPVDIYRSDAVKFLAEEEGIRPPLASMKSIGDVAAQSLAREVREGGRFLSQEEISIRAKVSKTVVETLNSYGALGEIPASRQLSLF